VAIELYSELTGFVQIFAGFTAEGSTNRNGAVKGGDFSLNSASFVIYLEMCSRL